ncbi:MAG: AAA family ATPase [Saprospiraceae bacterium]|nr:AAA family ATPase [Lewinella sp.]
MIERVGIKNFKSYKNAELKLAPLTVLIGANASGKTNALEAIRFLSWMAQGQKLSKLQNDDFIRGKIKNFPRSGEKSFTLECTINKAGLSFETLNFNLEEFNHLAIELEIRQGGDLHIGYEAISSYNMHTVPSTPPGYHYLYKTKTKSKGINTNIEVEYNNFSRGGKKPLIICNDQMSIFMQLASAARFQDGHKKARQVIPERTHEFEKFLSRIQFLAPVPEKMRTYSYKTEKKLLENGDHLSSVIYDLIENSEERSLNRKYLLQFISSLPEQNIADVGFISTPREEVMLELKETFGGKEQFYDTSSLSDGTLRVLSYAAAILSAPSNSLLIIEEFENGVHPSRADKLLKSIYRIAKERSITVLISTHNPALLDALPDEAIPKVVFCYRDPETGFSKLTRLEDLPHYPELIAQDTLGDLLTRGLIDHFVKHQPTEEERKRQASKWFESIK